MRPARLPIWWAVPCAVALLGTLSACEEAPESEVAAIFLPDQATVDAAKDELRSLGLPLDDVDPGYLGDGVCRSLRRKDSVDETRAIVREAVDRMASANKVKQPRAIDDATADRVIAIFRGPYCDQIADLPR